MMADHRETWISLAEFRALTGLSDETLITLLLRKDLPVRTTGGRGIEIQIDSDVIPAIVGALEARHREALERGREVLSARLLTLLESTFDEYLAEALTIVLRPDGGVP